MRAGDYNLRSMTGDYLWRMFGLGGRVAAVTGGGSGIGRRIAFALAAAGADVVLVGRRENLLREAAKEICDSSANHNFNVDDSSVDNSSAVRDSNVRNSGVDDSSAVRDSNVGDFSGGAKGGRAEFVVADLSEIDGIEKVAEKISACFGAPRILVNAAGVNLRSSSDPAESARTITRESWERTMAVNLSAPFFLSRALAGGMAGGGAILNIGSMQSVRAGLGDAAYTASKGGVVQLTRALARALGRDGITVNALLPGFFPSEMTDVVFSDSVLSARLAESTILGRNGALSDLEGAAVFFASPAAAYITGVLLPVDGGFLAK